MSNSEEIKITIEDIQNTINLFEDEERWTSGAMYNNRPWNNRPWNNDKDAYCAIGGITASMHIRQGKIVGYDAPENNVEQWIADSEYEAVSGQLNKLWLEWVEETNKIVITQEMYDKDSQYHWNEIGDKVSIDKTIWDAIEETNDNNDLEIVIKHLTAFCEWASKNGKLKSLNRVHPGNQNKADIMAITRDMIGR